MRWYVSSNGETSGPVEGEEVARWGREGRLTAGMFVRDEAGGNWTPIEQSPFAPFVPGAAAAIAARPSRNGLGYAILLAPLVTTVLIWLWVGQMNLLQDPSSTLWVLTWLTILGTAILIAVEAAQLGMGKEKGTNGKVQSGPVAWFLASALVWIVCFPYYLAARRHYGRTNLVVGGLLVAIGFTLSVGMMDGAIDNKKAEIRKNLEQLQSAFAR